MDQRWLVLIRLLVTWFGRILINMQQFSYKKMHLKCRLQDVAHFVADSLGNILNNTIYICLITSDNNNINFVRLWRHCHVVRHDLS